MRTVPSLQCIMLACLAMTLPVATSSAQNSLEYPQTRRVDHYDNYHGTKVHDPYRWLELDVRESEEVAAWVDAQNDVTFDYLRQIPEREDIRELLTDLWNYERYGSYMKRGGRYFFSRNDGLQNQNVIYTAKSLDEEPEVLLDPNTWSEDGTVALAEFSVSDDGRYAAYSVAEAGSDWRTWRIYDLEREVLLPEQLRWSKFSNATWTKDNKGFFYGRYDAPDEGEFTTVNKSKKLYYHRVGTPQSEDVLVYFRPDKPEWGYGTTVSEDGRYLVITIWKGTGDEYRVMYKDLTEPLGMPIDLIDEFEAEFTFLGNDGPVFYFKSNLDAPRGRILAIDIRRPEEEQYQEIVPEADDTLRDANIIGNMFVLEYLEDAKTAVRLYSMDGEHVRDVDLPGIGTASGFSGRRTQTETFYTFSSFATPPSVYRYDVITGQSALLHQADVDIDPDEYVTEQVFYTSKDGTSVPMFITHKKGIELDGSNPTLLYGYGGFNIPLTPGFTVTRVAWMEMGGVYAVANLRGGGEYGEEWHKAGTKLDKQNVFDDFIAAGEWLVENDYTRPDKLSILGGSNGGLLVGAVLNQRPDLFGAAIPAVGVMDMLRFHTFTIGWAWVDDYGSSEDPEEFEALYAYSPYHNIQPGTNYPAVMVTTADTDDRVVPAHSFKYAAALQHAQSGDAPVVIRIETRAGHGAGKPTSKRIEEAADMLSFLVHELEMDPDL